MKKSFSRACRASAPAGPRSSPFKKAWLESITHRRCGFAMNSWPLGVFPARFIFPVPNTNRAAAPIAFSMNFLCHQASGTSLAAAFIMRVDEDSGEPHFPPKCRADVHAELSRASPFDADRGNDLVPP